MLDTNLNATQQQEVLTQIQALEQRYNEILQQQGQTQDETVFKTATQETIQNEEIAPIQEANVEQISQPTTQQVESNLTTEVESNTQNIENTGDLVQVASEQQVINEPKELKDSKIRNENGSLMKVYHGTPYGGFTEFKDSHMGSNDNGGYLGDGFYFTDNYDYAKSYTDEEFMDKSEIGNAEPGEYGNPQVYETYLNIQNPYVINESDVEYDTNALAEALGTETNYQATDLLKKQGYDGVIYNFESGTKEYLVFDSKQIKILDDTKKGQETAVDGNEVSKKTENIQRTTPTQEELDNLEYIRKNKSGSEYASAYYDLEKKYGTGLFKGLNSYKSTGKAVDEIAPVEKEIKTLTKEVKELTKELKEVKKIAQEGKPLTIADLEDFYKQTDADFKAITETNEPMIQEDTTPDYEFENDNEGSVSRIESPLIAEGRDMENVGSRKVKAYQYENPEVRPFFQEMAKHMQYDLQNSTKGERMIIGDISQTGGGDFEYSGVKRHTTPDIADLLDNYNYTYADINKGLEAIIKDHGAENIAVSKLF